MSKPVAALIACVKSKSNRPQNAIDMYISPLFILSRKYAEQKGLPIFILSAKYGLIDEERVIMPYEKTVNEMKKPELLEWGSRVRAEFQKQFARDDTLLVLAGSKYLTFLEGLDNPIINPLEGLPIGKRLQWLRQHTK